MARPSAEAKLRELGLDLPPAPRPVATYVPAVQAGDLLFVSGVLPIRDGQVPVVGKVGRDLTADQGREAARLAALNVLALLRAQTGTLDRVRQLVRLVGHIACVETFQDHPAVLNGASALFVEVFGDAGRHARVALGAVALPFDAPVELELLVQLHPSV